MTRIKWEAYQRWVLQKYIQRALDPAASFFDDMGVNHGSFNIFVAKEFLNSSDVIAILQKMGSKTMAESVTVTWFSNFCLPDGILYGPL